MEPRGNPEGARRKPTAKKMVQPQGGWEGNQKTRAISLGSETAAQGHWDIRALKD